MNPQRLIRLENVRVNNLQGIDLKIPHGQWLSICGLSGSGKSSLALDTLYAEGQRRYLDCLSPRLRQNLTQLDKPDADRIEGLPPAISVQRPKGQPDRRTSLAEAADIFEHLRLLYSKMATIVCPECETHVAPQNPQSVAIWLNDLPPKTRFMVTFAADSDQTLAEQIVTGRKNGFLRAVVGDQIVSLEDPSEVLQPLANANEALSLYWIVDRLATGSSPVDSITQNPNGSNQPGPNDSQVPSIDSRTIESLETAFQIGAGQCSLFVMGEFSDLAHPHSPVEIDGRSFHRLDFSRIPFCSNCHRKFPVAEPKLFRFSNTDSVCDACDGIGFSDADLRVVCHQCCGDRFAGDVLAFRVFDKNLPEILKMTVDEAHELFTSWSEKLENRTDLPSDYWEIDAPKTDCKSVLPGGTAAKKLLPPIKKRLEFLIGVGLGYLALGRPLRTLSAGEAQRVSLTSCLGSTLVNMLYVLDEPSIGLHARDIERLSAAIGRLHDRGNTVVVVDHQPQLIGAATRIIEIGPEAGTAGGEIVFDGSPDDMHDSDASITGDFLAGRRGGSFSENPRPGRGKLRLTGARGHNLKNVDVEFPLNCLCVVTGVSGAGKSSLVRQTLYGAICQQQQSGEAWSLPFDDLLGVSAIDEVVLVDHSPIGRSGRSNPVTYVKAFDAIRKTFAETNDAKTSKLTAGAFSFNVSGGRCDKCQGNGQLTIDMQFLPEMHVKCDQCQGTRYLDATLGVRYRGLNIAEVLNLTVREAFSFFRGQPKVQSKLKALIDVGLEYIRLGQPATTLSAGEAQRLKLAVYLNASSNKRALFILEEPTTGLHPADVTRLVDCFDALIGAGHSVIVVEHNLHLIRWADWVIDLGPGAGESGGEVIVAGPPKTIADCADSITGQYLR